MECRAGTMRFFYRTKEQPTEVTSNLTHDYLSIIFANPKNNQHEEINALAAYSPATCY